MTVSVLQPCFIPDLYYIASLKNADKIVIQTNSTWSRKGRTHRFQIRTAEGLSWIGLPILTEDKKKTIDEVRIDHSDKSWVNKSLKTLEYSYKNSIYYDHYDLEIKADFSEISQFTFLKDAISYMNSRLWVYIEWAPESSKFYDKASNLSLNPILIKEELHATTFHFEESGSNFQWQDKLHTSSIKNYPIYRQHFGEFLEPCSILDLLFEVGPESYSILEVI